MSLRKISNGVTGDDIPGIGLIDNIKCKISELKRDNKLDLVEKKGSALIDFLGSYPSIIGRACPTASIANGFILNGMIYTSSFSSTDISTILNTCPHKENPFSRAT